MRLFIWAIENRSISDIKHFVNAKTWNTMECVNTAYLYMVKPRATHRTKRISAAMHIATA